VKVGDLIQDSETGDIGILIAINYESKQHNLTGELEPYRILNVYGKTAWFGTNYVEKDCEVVSESR
jgi:hypothetical protein